MTNDWVRHIYKNVESEDAVNVDTIKLEIGKDKIGRNIDKDALNPYHEIITNNIDKENIITLQMEQWSRLSHVVNYVQYNGHPRNFYNLDVQMIDQKSQ